MTIIHITLISFAGLGLFLIALCIPLAMQKVKPNGLYGFRTPKTLSNEKIWYEANRVAGIDLSLAGVLMIFTAIAMLLLSGTLSEKQIVIAMMTVTIGVLFGAVIHSFMALRRM
jgi:uncharacterized membrane protein